MRPSGRDHRRSPPRSRQESACAAELRLLTTAQEAQAAAGEIDVLLCQSCQYPVHGQPEAGDATLVEVDLRTFGTRVKADAEQRIVFKRSFF